MRIWDLHCHPEGDRVPGRTFAEKIDNLLEIASRMGIERLNMFLRVGETVSEKEVVDVLKRYPDKLSAFLWMTLWKYTVQENIDKVNRLVADGPLVGIKLAGGDGICSLPSTIPSLSAPRRSKPASIFMPGTRPAPGCRAPTPAT